MASTLINRQRSDRDKIPKLLSKVEGKGNGVKTVIVNMPEIAKSLNRPPMYPIKYIGCRLGTQANFDNKSGRYNVSGAHIPPRLQKLLDGFIEKYVQCQSCKNPDTILFVDKKKECLGMNCMACYHQGTIPIADDLVADYIFKNPPPKASMASTTAPTAGSIASRLGPKVSNDDTERGEDRNAGSEPTDSDNDDLGELDYGDDDDDYRQGSSSQALADEEEEEDDGEECGGVEMDIERSDREPNADNELRKRGHDECEDDQEDPEKDGDKVRCKFWPSCNAQEECRFYHPTKQCRDFLRCKFGDKCLYIHPPCKFSPNCTKANCPFSHPAVATTGVKRRAPSTDFRPGRALQQASTPKCKFGFKCTNIMCKFSHEITEACRYGANCLLDTCPYNHPTDSMPRKKPASVFKWSSQS